MGDRADMWQELEGIWIMCGVMDYLIRWISKHTERS